MNGIHLCTIVCACVVFDECHVWDSNIMLDVDNKAMVNLSNNITTTRRKNVNGLARAIKTYKLDNVKPGTPGNCELDSHANTCALGINFVPIYYTKQIYNVTPFSAEYKPTADIPIILGATAYTDPKTRVTIILIIIKAPWFGNRMTHLINPNQLRAFEIDLCDDPYGPHCNLSMIDHK